MWTCFFSFLEDFEKESSCFGEGKNCEFVKVCFVYAFEKAFNHNTKPFNHNSKKERKGKGEPKKLFLIANASSNFEFQMQGPARG